MQSELFWRSKEMMLIRRRSSGVYTLRPGLLATDALNRFGQVKQPHSKLQLQPARA
jgi:hypothetical protein